MSTRVADVRALVVIIGPPAAGKSKIARRVAELLGVNVYDTDKMVVAEHGDIPAIFETQGEPAFRRWEREAVSRALAEPGVVSLGGGAVLDEHTQFELRDAPVVLLTVSPDVVETRINNNKRPLLKNGLQDWMNLVAERNPLYNRLAKRTFDTSAENLDEIAADIVQWSRESRSQAGLS